MEDRIRMMFGVLVVVVVIFLGFVAAQVYTQTGKLNQIQLNQIQFVQAQNDAQLCAQEDIIRAVKGIGRKLGLPVGDIHPPDTEGINCEG